jgi:hypothetical protein
LEHRRIKELEKRVADLERLVDWLTGLLIDFVAAILAIGALDPSQDPTQDHSAVVCQQ